MYLTGLVFALLLTAGYLLGHVPMALLIAYGAMSSITFILYGLDKYAAIKGGQRIAESRLHLFALLGGWPGALLAQSLFRHKTRKRSFQMQFWLMSLLNGGLLAALLVWR